MLRHLLGTWNTNETNSKSNFMTDFSSAAVRDSETLAVYAVWYVLVSFAVIFQLLSSRCIQTQPPLQHIDIIQ